MQRYRQSPNDGPMLEDEAGLWVKHEDIAPSSGTLEALRAIVQEAKESAAYWNGPEQPSFIRIEDMARDAIAALVQPAEAERAVAVKAQMQCATEGCGQPATCEFSRKGVGSHYCAECFGKVLEAVEMSTPSPPQAGADSELVERGNALLADGLITASPKMRAWVLEAAATLSQLRARLAAVEAENKRWKDNWDANVQEMSEKFRAVNIAKVIEATGADIFALRDRAEATKAKLAEAREHVDNLASILDGAVGGILKETERATIRRARSFLSSIAEKTTPASEIAAERRRQIDQEGWTPEHDDRHDKGEMARAGGLYALIAGSGPTEYRNAVGGYHLLDSLEAAMNYWPWDRSWYKPTTRRRDLIKAGALILAEIERLDRAAARATK